MQGNGMECWQVWKEGRRAKARMKKIGTVGTKEECEAKGTVHNEGKGLGKRDG